MIQISEITQRMTALLDPHFTRDSSGRPIEQFGYLSRSKNWPVLSPGIAEWLFTFEKLPKYESSAGNSLLYCYGQNPSLDKITPGEFYVNNNDPTTNLEQALSYIKETLTRVPKRFADGKQILEAMQGIDRGFFDKDSDEKNDRETLALSLAEVVPEFRAMDRAHNGKNPEYMQAFHIYHRLINECDWLLDMDDLPPCVR